MKVENLQLRIRPRGLFHSPAAILIACLCMGLCWQMAAGQQPQGTPSGTGQQPDSTQPGTGQQEQPFLALPARAPGYELYYRSEDHNLAFATRWGYYDGWRDGKHDSELGISKPPTEQDRYKLVPDHGMHPGIPRPEYKTAYRVAYLHGYDYGAKAVNGVNSRPTSQPQ
jgi:hypothetical protein